MLMSFCVLEVMKELRGRIFKYSRFKATVCVPLRDFSFDHKTLHLFRGKDRRH